MTASLPEKIVRETAEAVAAIKAKVDNVDALQSRVLELEQRLADGVRPALRPASMSLGRAVASEFSKHAASLKSHRNVGFEVRAQITTGDLGGGHTSRDLTADPTLGEFWLPVAIQRTGSVADYTHYTRITGSTGAAAVQTEGTSKASTKLNYVPIAQKSLTIAGLTTATEQALMINNGLEASIDSHLRREILKVADSVLIAGRSVSGDPAEFEGLLSLGTAFTGASDEPLGDVVVRAKLAMAVDGFNADIVVFHPTDFAGLILERDDEGRPLNPNVWAGVTWPMAWGGMRVCLSSNVTQGKALVLDSGFAELVWNSIFMVRMGYVDDGFEKNIVTVRGEVLATPILTDVRALRVAQTQ